MEKEQISSHNNKTPFISIIILNFNQIEVTCQFLESCKNLTYPNFEIVLVDNASRENPEKIIKNKYPNVLFIRSTKNLGFTGGNNLGLRSAKGDFYFIVNNDTEVTPDLIEKLLQPFDLDPKIGMVSPKIKYFENSDIIQYAGYTPINPYTGRNRAIGMHQKDGNLYNTSGYTNYAHGAAMMVKKEVVEKTGMFSEVFFIYYEELDWSARIKKMGYKIYYNANAIIFHKESITMGKESAIKAYFHNRNRILFMKRNSTTLQFLVFCIFFLFVVSPKQILYYSLKGQKEHLRNFFRAILWNIKNINKKFE